MTSCTTWEAIELCLAGESLRAASSTAGCHPSTVHEAIERHGLENEWKRAREKRLRLEHNGEVPAVWARHFRVAVRPIKSRDRYARARTSFSNGGSTRRPYRRIVGSDELQNANALDHGGEEWDFVSNETRPLIRDALDSLTPPADLKYGEHRARKDHSGFKRGGTGKKVSPWKADILFRRRQYEAIREEHLLYILFSGENRWDGDAEARAWARENFIPNPEQPLWGIDRRWPHIVIMECVKMVEEDEDDLGVADGTRNHD